MEIAKEYFNPKYFENRELSWIKFNERVLNEARDRSIPLLERLKFLSITSSNLDEFFMVRVASLKDMVHAGYKKTDIAGMTATEQLSAINAATRALVETQYTTYNRSLVPLMKNNGIYVLDEYEKMNKEQAEYADKYFEENVYPVLTPMAVDASRPFPLIRNKTLNIVALLAKKEESGKKMTKQDTEFATVQVPSVLPRLVPIPSKKEGDRTYILLEQLIERNISKLFLNYNVLCAYPYRIMRNADLTIDEDEASDLLKEIQKQLKMRQWGEVIRLEVEDTIDEKLLNFLKEEFHIATDEDIYKINGPIDFTFLMKLYGMKDKDELRYEPYTPQRVPEIVPGENIFDEIKKGDILLHHPYQTFDPVVDFIRQAAVDPDVLAIKQTLYRVSGNSPIIASLAQAAENGKQVSVLVELKARFDEENNIVWAKMLEKAGCHVIYGLVGLKTHSKIALVVRREEDGIRRYVHLGTGNYNDSTAKLYTDCGMFTCSEAIGEDATAVFNMLSGYSEPLSWNKLVVAPIWLRKKFLKLIARETKNAKAGKQARIVAKMNSLCDREIIAALYAASAAGVSIDLIVRGICCLKVGIPGVSENIRVRSIVGNFLEHSRIFYFYNDGQEEIYMGSADWMPRNLDRRVEIIFPVEDENLRKKVKHILEVELMDNTKANVYTKEGTYEKIDKRGKVLVNSQEQFCREAMEQIPKKNNVYQDRVFIPAEPID
ncbi:MAG: RNA degradosome polyphosphate kinase [Lachnospiraceae bacterium]|nr:RNA degradosome polyphosphate kinase [Lachnospiraceae bacterium]MDD6169959.1 RNA degradosome polyphosphate kinase [Lachnospiraceae bacterium]MDY4840332.1 RNA degradosome polyphosphate kinase [Lachnospiraceae bacterium]